MAASPPARIAIVAPPDPDPVVVAAEGSSRFWLWPPPPEPVALGDGRTYCFSAGLVADAVAGAASRTTLMTRASQRAPPGQGCPSSARLIRSGSLARLQVRETREYAIDGLRAPIVPEQPR